MKSLRNGKEVVFLQREKRRSAFAWINCAFILKTCRWASAWINYTLFYVLKAVLNMFPIFFLANNQFDGEIHVIQFLVLRSLLFHSCLWRKYVLFQRAFSGVAFRGSKNTVFGNKDDDFQKLIVLLPTQTKHVKIMTALELNAELYRAMGEIADDETLMKKVLKYVKKLAATKKADPTLMTKEEFFRRVDEAKKGPSRRFASVEELDQYIRSL